jgi:ABC-type multidrug transport system ATPase subunit
LNLVLSNNPGQYFLRVPNEPRRELTNHNFFKFSGGEKAMVMYIPLFTGCYSRYKEAAAHEPYIIYLDEAFAGVDENNIKEMFEIVEQLDFNYIMNSQVLWEVFSIRYGWPRLKQDQF